MHNPAIEQEKQLQFEKDEAAYNALSPKRQRLAVALANTGFGSRTVLKGAVKTVMGLADIVFNIIFRLPYVVIGRAVKAVTNGMVRGIKLGVEGVASILQRIVRKKEDAAARKEKIDAWKKKTIARIDKSWSDFKQNLQQRVKKSKEFMEYHGALGLYRAAEWVLNPRTPSGKPLFGNESVNKFAGMAVAACAFGFLSFELAKMAVMANVWHVKIAHFIINDTAPLLVKIPKEASLHLLVTVVVTGSKFVALPVIAACRQALKSTHFTQAIAYQYNVKLKAQPQLEEKPLIQKLPLVSLVKNFVAYITEKASPEFYKARLKHYQELRLSPSQKEGGVGNLHLAGTFNGDAEKTPAANKYPAASSMSLKPPQA